MKPPTLESARAFWGRTERVRGAVLFLGGVGWDYATLRIDRLPDNVLLMAYLAVLFLVSVVELRVRRGAWVPAILARWPTIPSLGAQFLLGALLSAFAVHVFSATHPGPFAWFIVLLGALAIANEAGFSVMRGRVARVALFGFLTFQTFSLVVPFFVGTMLSPVVPLLVTVACVAALLALVLVPLVPADPPLVREGETARQAAAREVGLPIVGAAATLFALLVLIAFGVVPPLPLVMRDAVVARDVVREGDEYVLVEPRLRSPLGRMLFGPPRIEWAPGQKVSVFTAVFAPSGMELEMLHVWEWWDPELGDWTSSDTIRQHVKGGRVDGFRTWSTKRNLRGGEWRVRVQTSDGRELGRVRLIVEAG